MYEYEFSINKLIKSFDELDSKKINHYASGENFIKETKILEGQTFNKTIEIDVERLIMELKNINIRTWQSLVAENVNFIDIHNIIYNPTLFIKILWRTHKLIISLLEDKVLNTCIKMKKQRLHRIAMYDKESQLIVGTLTQKDILLFLIKNYTHEKEKLLNETLENIQDINIIKNVICVKYSDNVSHSFESLLQYRISSIPVVDANDRYLGMILKKDMYYIIKNANFSIVNLFLSFI